MIDKGRMVIKKYAMRRIDTDDQIGKMKKFLSITLAMFMTLAAMAGCGNSSAPVSSQTSGGRLRLILPPPPQAILSGLQLPPL